MEYGISIYEPNTERGARDAKSLTDAGIPKPRISIGKADVSDLFNDVNVLRSGDIVTVPAHDSLGERANTRAARLAACADRGVRVRVVGGDPVMYDTAEALAAFREASVAEQRAEQARQNVAKGKVGRKPKISLTPEQKDAVCALWWSDSRDGGIEARKLAAKYAGRDDMPVHFIKRWCSTTRTKPIEETKEPKP